MYLPYVIKYNAKDPVAAKRYAEIARRVGLAGASERALINSLCEKINEFNVILGIPATLKEFGIKEDEFKEKISEIAKNAVGDACTGLIQEQSIRKQWRDYLHVFITEQKLISN